MLSDSRQHPASDFMLFVKRKLAVGPSLAREQLVRSLLAFDTPADAMERGENSLGFSRRPVAH